MKKIKILVKSRFLSNEEMNDVQGGITCTVGSPYSNCQGFPPTTFTTCGPAQAMPTGYMTDGSSVLCGNDMQYGSSTCMEIGFWSTTCGTGSFYGGGGTK